MCDRSTDKLPGTMLQRDTQRVMFMGYVVLGLGTVYAVLANVTTLGTYVLQPALIKDVDDLDVVSYPPAGLSIYLGCYTQFRHYYPTSTIRGLR